MDSSNPSSEIIVGSGLSNRLLGMDDSQFDFILTESELEHVLAGGALPSSLDAGGPLGTSMHPSGLQFMPHDLQDHENPLPHVAPTTSVQLPIPTTGLGAFPPGYFPPDNATSLEVNIPPWPLDYSGDQGGGSGNSGSSKGRGGRSRRSAVQATSPTGGRQPQPNKAGLVTLIGADGKPHISHSVVEKQRRDRINNLIDELREIVPPQTAGGGGDANADSKRPKHIVLADTIALVRELQHKMRMQGDDDAVVGTSGLSSPVLDHGGGVDGEVMGGEVTTGAAVDLIRRTCPEATSPPGEQSSHGSDSRSGGACELPVAPEGVLTWSGVIVEPGETGSLYVKVGCFCEG